MPTVWFITGASRGLGREIARAALASGASVAATARTVDGLAASFGSHGDRLQILALDVTDPASAARAVDAAVRRFGRIDVLVNNAGHAQLGWFETVAPDDIRRQFEVNLFGAMNVARAVLPHMRERRAGGLVTISSSSGLVSDPGGSIYAASKFAVEGWIEGLAQEIEPLGLRSLLVEPGMLRTDFLDRRSARHGTVEIADYAEAAAQFQAFIAQANGSQPGDPVRLAELIVELVGSDAPPARLVFGEDAGQAISAKLARLGEDVARSAGLTA